MARFTFRPSHLAVAAVAALVAGGAAAAEYANVVSSTPVVGAVAVPRTECADVQRTVQAPPTGGGALVGAVVGGLLGNTIGHGGGRVLATGVGAVTGSVVGNNVEANTAPVQTYGTRDCRTVSVAENRVVGYDVVYEYNGQRYTTRMARDPGRQIAIDVRPAAAPLDRLAAAPVPPANADVAPVPVDPAYAAPPAAQPVPAYTYGSAPPVAYYAQPAYVVERPYYYGAPYYPYYWGPSISLGFGYWGGRGWYGGGWHGRGGWHH